MPTHVSHWPRTSGVTHLQSACDPMSDRFFSRFRLFTLARAMVAIQGPKGRRTRTRRFCGVTREHAGGGNSYVLRLKAERHTQTVGCGECAFQPRARISKPFSNVADVDCMLYRMLRRRRRRPTATPAA